MSESERLVRFELLGQEYSFYTAASEEDMSAVLTLVQRELEAHVGSRTGTLPIGKIAVMGCLNLASKYVQLKQEFDEYRLDNETRSARLTAEIRNSLS